MVLTRRSLMSTVLAAASADAFGQARDYSPGAVPTRYPDPDVVVLDRRFARYKIGNAAIQRLHTGMKWAEGPTWSSVGRYLVWNDIPANVKYRWLDDDGHISVFQKSANHSNGNTFDWEGRLICCENATHRVVRYEHNGSMTVLADSWQGKPLNEPNDVVVHPDGGIWFTAPGYGGDYEGGDAELGQKEAVYRIDAKTTKMDMVTDALSKPNGLCFSPDYKKLYIADSGPSRGAQAGRNIMIYDVLGSTRLSAGKEFASMRMKIKDAEIAGIADGIRADADGNVWASAGWGGPEYDGVHVFAPDGARIGQILLPEICANVCFGGPQRNRLFMTASQSLYAVYVGIRGGHIA